MIQPPPLVAADAGCPIQNRAFWALPYEPILSVFVSYMDRRWTFSPHPSAIRIGHRWRPWYKWPTGRSHRPQHEGYPDPAGSGGTRVATRKRVELRLVATSVRTTGYNLGGDGHFQTEYRSDILPNLEIFVRTRIEHACPNWVVSVRTGIGHHPRLGGGLVVYPLRASREHAIFWRARARSLIHERHSRRHLKLV